MGEPVLPGMPAPPPRARKDPKPGVRAHRTRATSLCELCCRLIHDVGVANAPYPRMARWRVVDGDTTLRLCEGHKEERMS